MTANEAKNTLAILKVAYPMMYRDATQTDADMAVALWASMFADESAEIVICAVKSWIATDRKGFPPSVGQIKDQIFRLSDGAYAISADEAWEYARNTMRRVGCSPYDKTCTDRAKALTPPEVWEVMERMGYRDMCFSENVDVLRGQFFRMWELFVARRRERSLIPPDVRQLIDTATQKLIGD